MTVVQNDIIRVTAEQSYVESAVQNVFHLRSTNATSVTDAQALLDVAQVMDQVFVFMASRVTTALAYDQVRAQNVTQDVLLGTTGFPTLVAGARSEAALPRQASSIITFPTAKPKTRGSIFMGGLTEADNDPQGIISSALLGQLVSVSLLLLAEIVLGPNSWRYVVFNTVLKTFVLPTGATIPLPWRTQRRRRPGVGI